MIAICTKAIPFTLGLLAVQVVSTDVRAGDAWDASTSTCQWDYGGPISFKDPGSWNGGSPLGCVPVEDGNPLGCDTADPKCGTAIPTPVPGDKKGLCQDYTVSGCSPHISYSTYFFNCLSVANYNVPVTVWQDGDCTGDSFKITAGGDYQTPGWIGHCVTIDC